MDNVVQLKKTALYERHVEANAKMAEFAGYMMPIEYPSGIIKEHELVRSSAGLFDLSHMGEIEIRGEWAEELVQYIIANDISALLPGSVIYTPVCNHQGGVVDDVLVYKMEDRIMLVVNASNKDKVHKWLMDQERWFCSQPERYSCLVVDRSEKLSIIAIQGPKAEEILQKVTPVNLSEIGYYTFVKGGICKSEGIISRTGYTGEDGFELYVPNEDAVAIWDTVLDAGREYGLAPIGLGARDTLRFEAKYPLYGHELNDDRTPFESGIGWAVKLEKNDFIGKDPLKKFETEKPARKMIGFEMKKPGIARKDHKVFNAEGKEIGVVTSGSFSPSLKKNLGLAVVDRKGIKIGTQINIEIRGRMVPAQVIKTPFYKGSVKSAKKNAD
ncbi:MAG: glycine cleavage system aminomethyltransferase GcvT [Firmicutes bacterium]|nr:glycine cleavage system aminomethyltransferase GcvT [Bacillota bacterium]